MEARSDRAQGCLLGQLIGDALGSLVEFQTPDQIRRAYPDGVRDLADGGTWNTIAGQPTDDSEMALALARTIVRDGGYDQAAAREAYVRWMESSPFDIGNTVSAGLSGVPNFESQSNGSLMRISPLGIYCALVDADLAARLAREDAWITHPHEVPQDANALFVLTLATTIRGALSPRETYDAALEIANEYQLTAPVLQALRDAAELAPPSYTRQQGWVLIGLQNTFYQLLHAGSVEEALIDTVTRGGDTDTNAAIAGALLGAAHGRVALPERWVEPVLSCRPSNDRAEVRRPRPEEYWPVDALELADQLLSSGATSN